MRAANGYRIDVGWQVAMADRSMPGYSGRVVRRVDSRLVRVDWHHPRRFTSALPASELVALGPPTEEGERPAGTMAEVWSDWHMTKA